MQKGETEKMLFCFSLFINNKIMKYLTLRTRLELH